MTGHADVPTAVAAMKAGALDFIVKPFRHQVLLDSIEDALRLDSQRRRQRRDRQDVQSRLELLTSREREVLDHLITGKTNKNTAYELGISQKTVDFHRANILDKVGVGSLVELLCLLQGDVAPWSPGAGPSARSSLPRLSFQPSRRLVTISPASQPLATHRQSLSCPLKARAYPQRRRATQRVLALRHLVVSCLRESSKVRSKRLKPLPTLGNLPVPVTFGEVTACSSKENPCSFRPSRVRCNSGDELLRNARREMSTVGSVMQGRRPILLIGNLGQEAPAVHQALDELGSDGQEIRSVASVEVLPHVRGAFAEGPGVLLLALEGTSGAELSILRTLKEDEHLRSLPVVVLGPSGDTCLVKESFGLGAAGYMASSADPRELAAVIRTVGQYWNLSKLPRQA